MSLRFTMALMAIGMLASFLYAGVCKEVRPGLYAFCFDKPYPGEEISTIYFGTPQEMAHWVYERLAPFVPPKKPTGIKRTISLLTGGLLFRDPPEHPQYAIDPKLASKRALDLWQALMVIPPEKKIHNAFINVIYAHGTLDTLKPLYEQLKRKPGMVHYWDVFAYLAQECLRLAQESYKEYEGLCQSNSPDLSLTVLKEKLDRTKAMAELAKLLDPADEKVNQFLKELYSHLGIKPNK